MTEMTSTVAADDLGPLHAKCVIDVSLYSTRDRIIVGGPAAAGLELVLGRIERCVTPGAVIHALCRMVCIVLASAGGLGALLAKDSELLCISQVSKRLGQRHGETNDGPGLRTALH